jgi:hypothetical protein
MIAMQLTGPDISGRQVPRGSTAATGQESERSCILPADHPATLTAQFQPLDPDVVSEGIPAFFIGRNKEGFWVARDAKGRIGGIFLLENSALSFARENSRPAGCATIFPSERFELDLENRGNPLIVPVGDMKHFVSGQARRIVGLVRLLAAAAGSFRRGIRFAAVHTSNRGSRTNSKPDS